MFGCTSPGYYLSHASVQLVIGRQRARRDSAPVARSNQEREARMHDFAALQPRPFDHQCSVLPWTGKFLARHYTRHRHTSHTTRQNGAVIIAQTSRQRLPRSVLQCLRWHKTPELAEESTVPGPTSTACLVMLSSRTGSALGPVRNGTGSSPRAAPNSLPAWTTTHLTFPSTLRTASSDSCYGLDACETNNKKQQAR